MSKSLLAGITNRVLMLVAAGLLVLSFASAFVNPTKAWYLVLVGLLFFPLALLNLFLLLWALVRRSKAFLIPLIAFLPTVFFIGRYFQFSDAVDDLDEVDESVRVVSYNVGRFACYGNSRKGATGKECADSVYAFLNGTDADIICLQEYAARNENALKQELSRHFKGYHYEYYVFSGKYGCFGNVVLSRLPIVGKGVVKFDHSSNLALYTDIRTDDGTFRLYNCHFESYNISFPGIVKALTERSRKIFKDTENKMRRSVKQRPLQVQQVLDHIAECPVETILCGDFNDNPMSYTYQRLIKDHNDTFCEAGKGVGATYSMLWPALRIDYIFLPEEYVALTHKSPKLDFSDHYPVVSDFALRLSE